MEQTKRSQRKPRSKEFWERHVRGCSESGLTQKEYCVQNDLGPKSLVYWKSKLRKESKEISFVNIPLPIQKEQTSNEPIILICNDKYRIEIGNNFHSDSLKRIIQTIESL